MLVVVVVAVALRRLAETRVASAESMSITDRVCFDVSYKYERPGGRAAEALETVSFRTRRGFKSARIWIQPPVDQMLSPSVKFRSHPDVHIGHASSDAMRDGASFALCPAVCALCLRLHISLRVA